jgi:hypothetical protein
MIGSLFIDIRQAIKFKDTSVGAIDFLELVEETNDHYLFKLKTAFSLREEWAPGHNWSEKITINKKDLPKYIKQDRFVSGSVWIPIQNNFVEAIELLNEKRMSSIEINKQLSSQIYESNFSNVNEMLGRLGKFL